MNLNIKYVDGNSRTDDEHSYLLTDKNLLSLPSIRKAAAENYKARPGGGMSYSKKKDISICCLLLFMFCPIQAKTIIWVIWPLSRMLLCVVQTQRALNQIDGLTQEELKATPTYATY